jgi:hypothetical protein
MRAHVPKRWRYLIPLLVLLLMIAAAAYALNRSAAASALPANTAPERVAAVDTAALKPGELKQLPNGVIVGRDVKHDISSPLRDIPPAPASALHEGPENPQLPFHPSPRVADPVVQRFFGPLAMPTPILSFEGISAAISACGCLPPDTNGEAGPNHYIQTVNAAFEIWDKNGNVVQSSRQIKTLWTGFGGICEARNDGDPIVNYDQLADRWLISQFAVPNAPTSGPSDQCFAVSATGDPTGQWYRYDFHESNTDVYDYPKVGIWPDAYYMSTNVFGQNFHPAFAAFDRVQMLGGLSATFQEFNPGYVYSYAALPADLDGSTPPPTGAPEPFLSLAGNSTQLYLWHFHVDWTTPLSSTLDGPTFLAAAPWDPNLCGLARNCIPQPGVGANARLDTLGDHTMFRLAYRNFGDHESMVTNESVDENGQDHAGIRWYEVRDPNGRPFIYQQGTYAPDADHRWLGSVAQDRNGNMAVGYSVSSSTTSPSIRYAGRLTSDPLGQLGQGETTLIAGSGSQQSTSGRRGDYSDMTVDPTDDCTFWFTNEYYATTSGAGWQTRIGKFKFPSCGPTTPTPTVTGTPPTATATPSATGTPIPLPTVCSSYTSSIGTATIVSGTVDIGTHCDDCNTLLALPFPVQIYDQSFSSAYVTSNGTLQFGSSDFTFANACLPVPIFDYTIMAFWDDLTTTGAGHGIFTSTTGTAPNRIFNIEWRAQSFAAAADENFEIRLYETPAGGAASQFDIVYGAITDPGSETVGVQRDPAHSQQYECDTAGLTSGMLLTYSLAPCPTATATPTTVPSATRTPVPPTTTPVPPTATPPACTIAFSDVHPTDYFYEPVRYLYCRNVVSGYGDGTFRPYNNTTRAQMVKIVVLGFGIPIATPAGGAHTFTDVLPDNPFFSVIETAAAHGIVNGYNTTPPCGDRQTPCFQPNANVTRGQLSKIDVVAAGWALITPPTTSFTDVPAGSPFFYYVETAVCHGIISGYSDNTFHPNANATRGQISKIVYLSLTNAVGACTITPAR